MGTQQLGCGDTPAWVWSTTVKKKQLRFSSKAALVSLLGATNDD